MKTVTYYASCRLSSDAYDDVVGGWERWGLRFSAIRAGEDELDVVAERICLVDHRDNVWKVMQTRMSFFEP